jgi:AraC-like DNA-binding protein
MGYVSKINKGIDFIESNLMAEFDLAEVSTAAGMSQWHFQRKPYEACP